MKVLILGLPYFSDYIKNKLQEKHPKHTFTNLDTYYSIKDKLRYLFELPFSKVIYTISGATHGSRSINLAILLKKKIVFHWVGPDLLLAKTAFKNNKINQKYIDKVSHITDTPWFVSELQKIGINAKFVPLNAYNLDTNTKLRKPKNFSILTYIRQGNEQFYGIESVLTLAEKFPDIQFNIAGMDIYTKPLPKNIKLLGWVEKMKEEIMENWICLRLPEHDGLSFFVLESLALKRHVIYNQEFNPATYVKDIEEAEEKIRELYTKFKDNTLELNEKGNEYVQANFNEENVIKTIFNALTEH